MSDSPESSFYEIVLEGGKKFICKHNDCGKVFRFKSEMERHMAIHSSSRPYKCQYKNCIKTFKRSDALENHIRCSHKREAAYVCPFPGCEMPFATRSSFQVHVLIHNTYTSEESLNPDQSGSIQMIKNRKLNPQKKKSVNPNQSSDDVAFNHQYQLNFEKDLFVPVIMSPAENIECQLADECPESTTEPSKIERTEKWNQIANENKFLKEKLKSNEKTIKCMQTQINGLLTNFCTFHLEIENKSEKELNIPDLSDLNNSFVQEDLLKNPEHKEERLSEISDYGQGINMLSITSNIDFEISSNKSFLDFRDDFEFGKN